MSIGPNIVRRLTLKILRASNTVVVGRIFLTSISHLPGQVFVRLWKDQIWSRNRLRLTSRKSGAIVRRGQIG